jgi:hypothetical protein
MTVIQITELKRVRSVRGNNQIYFIDKKHALKLKIV